MILRRPEIELLLVSDADRRRRVVPAVCGAALLLAALTALRSSSAQVIVPGGGTGRGFPVETAGGPSPSTRELQKRFDRARNLLADENYDEVARLLQTILDSDEDVFSRPDSQPEEAEQSLKLKAHRLFSEMPAEGRAAYERQQGPAARRALDAALKSHDVDAMAQVARRFFHTQAGHDAVYQLAADHFDHDRPLLAAVEYERLLSAPGVARRFEPYLSVRCASSWMRAGQTDRAVDVLATLHRHYPRKTLNVAGRDVELFDDPAQALTWLAGVAGASPAEATASPPQWTTVGGDASRNAPSAGGSPYLNRFWRTETVSGATNLPEHDALLVRTFEARRSAASAAAEDDSPVPSLPTVQPLIVDDLVIARGIGDLRAYEAASGRLVWVSGEKDQMLLDVLRHGAGPQAQVGVNAFLSSLVASRGWEDTTFGTLSSDGEFVFAIEDLQIHPVLLEQYPTRRWHSYNRLVAYDVKTGRAMWEAGGPRGGADESLAASYFLGSPLVLDRRLYCLVETGGDIRLVVLDPRTGRLDWQQTLTTPTPTEPPAAYARRQSGLTPSFSGDILVCPIGSEQVVAMSLAQRTLAWRYRLQQPSELFEPAFRRRPGMRINIGRLPNLSQIDQNGWLDAHVTIADLKVVVTPRDSEELFCLNLLDGSLAWKKPRGEGLLVAGIHRGKVLVVGRSFVQALKLADGEPAWARPANLPAPSGRGFIAGEYLHLPLATAEVATINLNDGRVVARAKSIAGNVPGNLAAVRGTVVSQGPDFVEGYRQLDALEAEIARALAQNPDDAQSLALRGEIQLQRGKTAEAYLDLKRALELKSDDAAIRSLLVGSLLEGLRVDFNSYRGLEGDIEALLSAPQERATYLWLRAEGLKRSGDAPAALAALLKFGDPGVADQDLERVDAALVVRRDRLVRARTAELFAAAAPDLRVQIARALAAQAEARRGRGDSAGLRRLWRYFGGSVATESLDRLNAGLPLDSDWLTEEFRLEGATGSSDPQAAASAAARLVQLMLTAERPRDALVDARRLARRWPEAVALDGKTGRALSADWLARSEIAREVALESPWPAGAIEVERLGAVGAAGQRHFEIPIIGQRGAYFEDARVQIAMNWKDVSARDSLGRTLWKLPLDFPVAPGRPQLNRGYVNGHFLLLSIGSQLLALDVLGTADEPGPRLLWRYSFGSPLGREGIPQRRLEVGLRRRFVYNEMGELAGTIGPVTSEQVVLMSGRKLLALDPLSGRTIWAREGVSPGSELFGDERVIYVVAPEAAAATVYDAVDGRLLGERPLPPASKRIDTLGAHVITWRTKDSRQVLARLDPWTGKELWSRDFEDTAQLSLVELDEAAILEISGKLTLLSLSDGRVRFETATEPEPDLRQIHVIRSRDRYVVIANQPPEITGWQQVTPQTITVHGRVYGFDRATGKRLWVTEVYRQGIDLNQPSELPVLTFLCHYSLQRNNVPGYRTYFGLTCLDTRNGRLVIDNREFDEQLLFVEYIADPDQRLLDLRLFRSVLRLTFSGKPDPAP
ncbi:MAG: PQQ-binding-like beta-propeller repeat protein [Planctomycetia bacterium]|nr:PQQ-binding-like beta-propeller repeat protein [Planctomycetia bacterium]